MIDEVWKPVPGWAGFYEVSDHGRVRSVDREIVALNPHGQLGARRFKGKVLAAPPTGTGYPMVVLTRPGAREYRAVHTLVMRAFVGQPPTGLEVCHNDGVKTHCRLTNLRYDTRKANAADTTAHGQRVSARGEEAGSAKLTEAAVQFIRANPHLGFRALGRQFNVAHSTVAAAARGESWAHI